MSEPRINAEIAVVGAGPAGLAAATVAAESGRRVLLLDDTPWLGGQIWRGEQAKPGVPLAQRWIARFQKSGAALLERASAVAVLSPASLLAETPAGSREIAFEKIVLATGAREIFLPFPGWTLPGVMGPGGLYSLAKHGWPVEGKRVVIAGSGPLLLATAEGLAKLGARVTFVAEQAPWWRVLRFGLGLLAQPDKIGQAIRIRGRLGRTPYRCGVWPLRAQGEGSVREVVLTDGAREWTEACDLFACGFGLAPSTELPTAFGCELDGGFVRVDQWQAASAERIYCAGEPTGIGGAEAALIQGQIAGYAAACQPDRARALFGARAKQERFGAALKKAFALRPELQSLAADDTVVCRCEDVTLGRLKAFDSWRDAKLQTRCGMGACQGRVCGAALQVIRGWGAQSVRPPVLPARIESLLLPSAQSSTEKHS